LQSIGNNFTQAMRSKSFSASQYRYKSYRVHRLARPVVWYVVRVLKDFAS
jgi:hypothetical protein